MSPYIFLFLAFAFTIANRLYGKFALNRLDSFALALSTNVFGTLLSIPFAWTHFSSIKTLGSFYLGLIIFSGILWTYISWAGNLSVAQNNYSFKEIIRQTRIIWVVLAGIFLLGESITVSDFIGILLITSSIFIISFKEFSFKDHFSSKAILLAWSVSLVAAVIALLEKVIVDNVEVLLYMIFAYLLPTFFLLLFLTKERVGNLKLLLRLNLKEAIICALLMFASYYLSLIHI
jgi:drug/metabolite transporter (DMT)-like permease